MASADDHERFMRLFLRYEPEILRFVLAIVPQLPDARDIVQETAVALWRRFDAYEPERPFGAWACGYARIETLRFLRRAHQRTQLSAQAALALMRSESARAGDDELREQHLAECLRALPLEHRRLVTDYYFEEKPVEALAGEHRRTIEAVYKTLQRIRQSLLKCLQRKMTEART
ncbi:MAG: sigma-70 family RNA polymerase sigma factor [Verrucomicrobia bacterium]|nr:sigma-70 family RNA polymerase sigma factor [Verrucomicrobiota bacterium]